MCLLAIPHWERAVRAWTDLNVIDYRGNTQARDLIVETEFYYKDVQSKRIPNRYKFDVLITTYEMASAGSPHIRDIPWKCAVFDEAHRLKNKVSISREKVGLNQRLTNALPPNSNPKWERSSRHSLSITNYY